MHRGCFAKKPHNRRVEGTEWPLRVDSGQLGDLDRAGLITLPPLGPGRHHVDVAAAALGAEKPLAPLWNCGLGAVTLGHRGGVGLAWWPQALHQTISRTRAAAALPSVIGGPGAGFIAAVRFPRGSFLWAKFASLTIPQRSPGPTDDRLTHQRLDNSSQKIDKISRGIRVYAHVLRRARCCGPEASLRARR